MMYSKEDQLRGKSDKKFRQIPHQSKAMQAFNAEYHCVLDKIDQEREPECEECKVRQFSHSHLIKRNFNGHAYMNAKENIRRQCDHHHTAWEQGRLYLLPNTGKKCLNIVKSLDEQYYRQKVEQFRKRLEEYKSKNWLAISQGTVTVPAWCDEIIEDFYGNQ